MERPEEYSLFLVSRPWSEYCFQVRDCSMLAKWITERDRLWDGRKVYIPSTLSSSRLEISVSFAVVLVLSKTKKQLTKSTRAFQPTLDSHGHYSTAGIISKLSFSLPNILSIENLRCLPTLICPEFSDILLTKSPLTSLLHPTFLFLAMIALQLSPLFLKLKFSIKFPMRIPSGQFSAYCSHASRSDFTKPVIKT